MWAANPNEHNYGLAPAHYAATTIRCSLLVGLGCCVAGFLAVSRPFGVGAALVVFLLLAPALFVAVRLRRRWPNVRPRELVYLAVLVCIGSGGIVFVVRDWYDKGLQHRHAEDLQWAEFERLLRRDPAFRNVKINLTDRKHIYWASGTIETEADLDRLRSLAAECGIEGRIDGPFVHSVSLKARVPNP